jgi:heat shock protein HslJ
MKKILLIITVLSIIFSACNCSKKSTAAVATTELQGSWQLTYISGPKITFDGLYPDKKPFIKFDLAEKRFSGNNSCNSYTAPLKFNGNTIDFTVPIISTEMACPGSGEAVYMSTLKKVDRWSVEGTMLTLSMGDVMVMKFSKN